VERIRVEASRGYDVIIESGILTSLGEYMKPLIAGRRCTVISDDTTHRLFGEAVKSSLCDASFSVAEYVLPHGEESKSAANLIAILEFLAEAGLTRADCVVALGGGVVGDITGFAAACFLRGIAFVQVPTTLLSAVDSSVGGKTAINLRAGKNLAGAFYQPRLVLCDTDIIGNLPDEIFSDGMAEVIKYGALGSEKVLDLCLRGAHENLAEVIAECVKIKRDIVAQDEFDTDLRKLLNLGHTPAHAIERLSDFKISHGKAVAIGMCLMSRSAERMGLCQAEVSGEIEELCRKYSLPTGCTYDAADMAKIAMSDKKRSSDMITLVIPSNRGESILRDVPVADVEMYFRNGAEGIK